MRRVGWRNEPRRHALAARGIATAQSELALVVAERHDMADTDDDIAGVVPSVEPIDIHDYQVEELGDGDSVVEEGDVIEIEQEDGEVLEYSIVDGVAMSEEEAAEQRLRRIREQTEAITRKPEEKRAKPAKMNLFEVMAATRRQADYLDEVGKAIGRKAKARTKTQLADLRKEQKIARENLGQTWSGVDRSDKELALAYRGSHRRIAGELKLKEQEIRSQAKERQIEVERYKGKARDYRKTAKNLRAFITYREEQATEGHFNDEA